MTAEESGERDRRTAKRGNWEFEPGLVDILLSDIGAHGTSEPEPGALPLLSHALLATWEPAADGPSRSMVIVPPVECGVQSQRRPRVFLRTS